MTGEPQYDNMIELVEACTFSAVAAEIETIPDPMDRLRAYARIASNLAPERMLAKIRVGAERHLCEAIGRSPVADVLGTGSPRRGSNGSPKPAGPVEQTTRN